MESTLRQGGSDGSNRRGQPQDVVFVDQYSKRFRCDIEYDVKEQIGRGAYSTVKRARHRRTSEEVAIKIVDKKKNFDVLDMIKREIEVMRLLSHHPNIVRLRETFEDAFTIEIVMDLIAGGELFEVIVEKGFFDEDDSAFIIRQVLLGILHCHENRIVHRDLKPENLLCVNTDDGSLSRIVICDFGVSCLLPESGSLKGRFGSPDYISPEMHQNQPYSFPTDMWALGVISYIILAGYPPFQPENEEDEMSISTSVINDDVQFPEEEWDAISPEAKDFIKRLLHKEPSMRITARDALMHPFMSSRFQDSLQSLLMVTESAKAQVVLEEKQRAELPQIPPLSARSATSPTLSPTKLPVLMSPRQITLAPEIVISPPVSPVSIETPVASEAITAPATPEDASPEVKPKIKKLVIVSEIEVGSSPASPAHEHNRPLPAGMHPLHLPVNNDNTLQQKLSPRSGPVVLTARKRAEQDAAAVKRAQNLKQFNAKRRFDGAKNLFKFFSNKLFGESSSSTKSSASKHKSDAVSSTRAGSGFTRTESTKASLSSKKAESAKRPEHPDSLPIKSSTKDSASGSPRNGSPRPVGSASSPRLFSSSSSSPRLSTDKDQTPPESPSSIAQLKRKFEGEASLDKRSGSPARAVEHSDAHASGPSPSKKSRSRASSADNDNTVMPITAALHEHEHNQHTPHQDQSQDSPGSSHGSESARAPEMIRIHASLKEERRRSRKHPPKDDMSARTGSASSEPILSPVREDDVGSGPASADVVSPSSPEKHHVPGSHDDFFTKVDGLSASLNDLPTFNLVDSKRASGHVSSTGSPTPSPPKFHTEPTEPTEAAQTAERSESPARVRSSTVSNSPSSIKIHSIIQAQPMPDPRIAELEHALEEVLKSISKSKLGSSELMKKQLEVHTITEQIFKLKSNPGQAEQSDLDSRSAAPQGHTSPGLSLRKVEEKQPSSTSTRYESPSRTRDRSGTVATSSAMSKVDFSSIESDSKSKRGSAIRPAARDDNDSPSGTRNRSGTVAMGSSVSKPSFGGGRGVDSAPSSSEATRTRDRSGTVAILSPAQESATRSESPSKLKPRKSVKDLVGSWESLTSDRDPKTVVSKLKRVESSSGSSKVIRSSSSSASESKPATEEPSRGVGLVRMKSVGSVKQNKIDSSNSGASTASAASSEPEQVPKDTKEKRGLASFFSRSKSRPAVSLKSAEISPSSSVSNSDAGVASSTGSSSTSTTGSEAAPVATTTTTTMESATTSVPSAVRVPTIDQLREQDAGESASKSSKRRSSKRSDSASAAALASEDGGEAAPAKPRSSSLVGSLLAKFSAPSSSSSKSSDSSDTKRRNSSRRGDAPPSTTSDPQAKQP